MKCFSKILCLFSVMAMVSLAGCSGGTDAPVSLEIADLEKVDSWEKQAKAHAKLTEMMAGVMDGVTDQASAEAAIEKFKRLASQFAALNRAEEAIGKPSADDKKNALKIVGPANEKFDAAYTKLGEKEELFKVVEEALDKAYVGEEF